MSKLDGLAAISFLNVRELGASGDGVTLDTAAIQRAIDKAECRGGGTVYFPAGSYHLGALFLRSNLTLYLDAGAVLLGSLSRSDYPLVLERWEGATQRVHASCISGQGLQNIAIRGQGTLDCRGELWWKWFLEKTLEHPRPRGLSFTDCRNLLIEGIRIINSPSWTINPVRCENITIRGLTIQNPPDSPNTDGINPDSCRNVHISDCHISVGDDCIALKAGSEAETPGLMSSCSDITITNCTLERGHGGIVIGSETSGGVRNVVISNCVFNKTDRGIRLKSRRGRGGIVEDIRVSNIVMVDVLCPFTMNLYYACSAWGDPLVSDKNPRPVDDGTPMVRSVHLSGITAKRVKLAAAYLYGLAETPLEEVSLSDWVVEMDPESREPEKVEMADGIAPMCRFGVFAKNVRDLRISGLRISGQCGSGFHIEDSRTVELHRVGTSTADAKDPFILLRNVQDACIHGCHAGKEVETFLRLEGEATRQIAFLHNALSGVKTPVSAAAEVDREVVEAIDCG